MYFGLKSVYKKYAIHQVNALVDVNLEIGVGEFIAIMGPSGCGKSTLLSILAGIEKPDSGKVYLLEQSIDDYSEAKLSRLRLEKIGFVFQSFNLLNSMNVFENISLPLELSGQFSTKEICLKVGLIMEKLDILSKQKFFPAQLSGGEMQRVAIARALIHNPELVLADEPTGNLDSQNGEQVLGLLSQLCIENKQTLVMVTHSVESAKFAKKIVKMRDGTLIGT